VAHVVPRLPIWEDANDRGLVEARGSSVRLTPAGLALLKEQRPHSEALATAPIALPG
jgi:hypothetical protein